MIRSSDNFIISRILVYFEFLIFVRQSQIENGLKKKSSLCPNFKRSNGDIFPNVFSKKKLEMVSVDIHYNHTYISDPWEY